MTLNTSNQYPTQNKHQTDIVQFTPLQLEYLESLFPQVVYNANHTEASMRHYFGTQAVLSAIRNKTNGLAKRNINIPNTIPTPD